MVWSDTGKNFAPPEVWVRFKALDPARQARLGAPEAVSYLAGSTSGLIDPAILEAAPRPPTWEGTGIHG